MIETTIPEIDVTQLMARVREEASNIRSQPRARNGKVNSSALRFSEEPLPQMPILRPPPASAIGSRADLESECLSAMLQRALDKITVRSAVPKLLRWLFRKQGAFNRAILDVTGFTARNISQLHDAIVELRVATEAQSAWLKTLSAHIHEQANWMALAARRFEGIAREAAVVQATAARFEERQSQFEERQSQFEERQSQFEQRFAAMEEHQILEASYLKSELSHQASMLQRFSSNGKDFSNNKTPAASLLHPGELDSFYLAFEDRFRGPRPEIKDRLRFYLPFLAAVNAGSREHPVLDLGCGRGEWLELLSEKELSARGVDLNSVFVAQDLERGFDVIQADALEHLRALPEGSLGAVTGFHIIEHLPFGVLLDLAQETLRTLAPGGVAIFESPNCKNIVVGASNFYSDPTHIHPVFPDTAAFMLELKGFTKVLIHYLNPVEDDAIFSSATERSKLRNWFYGPRDFAVIAHKAAV